MDPGLAIVLLLFVTLALAGVLVALQRRLVASEAARRRLETLIENAPVAIGSHDSTGRITQLNHAFRKLFGYGPGELQTVEDWWPRAYPDPVHREAARRNALEIMARSRREAVESGPQPSRITSADGSLKDIEFHYIGLDGIGVWTMIDMSEHRRSEDAARLANEHLLGQLAENRRLQEALREQANRDPLTGLFNRRYLDETLEREIARAVREGYPVTVMMLDIDHFKRLNDTYGHLAGDEMLRCAARQLTASARHEDIVCRFGGEEFAVVLPKMPIETARQRAELWRQQFADDTVTFGSFTLRATISIGVAAFPGHGRSRDELMDAADRALYRAKDNGRNRVELAGSD